MNKKTAAIAVVLVVLVGGGVWYANRGGAPEAPGGRPLPVPAPTADTPPPMPTAEEADNRARALIVGLSPRAELAAWAQQKDLVRRFVALVDNVADGKVPRPQFEFLVPRSPFKPGATDRWNTFADVVASVDAQKLAAAYKELHPLFDAAYREMAPPGATFDSRMKEALARVAATPAPEKMPAVKPAGALYVYVDPKLEELKPAEKQLLRMGPRNQKLVQDKARELSKALGF